MFNSYICSPNLRMWRNGSRTRLRIWRLTAWGFESLHPHHKAEKPSLSAGFYTLWMLRQAEKPGPSAGFYALWMRPSDSIEQPFVKSMPNYKNLLDFKNEKHLVSRLTIRDANIFCFHIIPKGKIIYLARRTSFGRRPIIFLRYNTI